MSPGRFAAVDTVGYPELAAAAGVGLQVLLRGRVDALADDRETLPRFAHEVGGEDESPHRRGGGDTLAVLGAPSPSTASSPKNSPAPSWLIVRPDWVASAVPCSITMNSYSEEPSCMIVSPSSQTISSTSRASIRRSARVVSANSASAPEPLGSIRSE